MMVGAVRLVLVLLLALLLVACQGFGGPGGGGASPRPTPEETDEAEATDEAEETDEAEATDEGEATDDPDDNGGNGEGETVSVFDLDVGDCFNVDEDSEIIEEVELLDCDAEHFYEVFALVEHPADDDEEYPGEDELDDFAFNECEGEFEDYVGAAYEDSDYYITYLTPSEQTWAVGDREVVCVLQFGLEAEPVEGSGRDSGD